MTPEPPPNYRFLALGERIQPRDVWVFEDGVRMDYQGINRTVTAETLGKVARKIP